LTENRSPGR